LKTDGGTGNFGGFKSGCTSNLIAANGVLNAPDYTRTCACSYQNQTSLSLIHMSELEYWTHSSFVWSGQPVKQVGIKTKEYSWVGASGVSDFSEIEIILAKEAMENTTYTVNLFFAEMANLKSGNRLSDINIQGKPALHNFDIVKKAAGAKRLIVKSFKGIKVKDKLIIQCKSSTPGKPPLLSGVEVIMEDGTH